MNQGGGGVRTPCVRMAAVGEVPVTQPGRDTPDDVLVRRVVARDGRALEALYDRYGRPVYALARRITGDDRFAEDVVQEVFLALWRDPTKFEPGRGAFASWLLAAAHHKAVDAVRREESLRRHRARAAEEAVAYLRVSGPPPVDDAAWTALRGDRVRQALHFLPQPQREAIVLAYYAGYTQREIAALTETPLGTVKTRMLAGMRRLRDLLDAAPEVEEAPR